MAEAHLTCKNLATAIKLVRFYYANVLGIRLRVMKTYEAYMVRDVNKDRRLALGLGLGLVLVLYSY